MGSLKAEQNFVCTRGVACGLRKGQSGMFWGQAGQSDSGAGKGGQKGRLGPECHPKEVACLLKLGNVFFLLEAGK